MPGPQIAPTLDDMGRRLLVYTLLRAALFALATAVFFFLVRLSLPISVVLGLLVSSFAALTLLRSQRDELTTAMLARREAKQEATARRRAALDEPESAEPDVPGP